jgi:hypothetical protein
MGYIHVEHMSVAVGLDYSDTIEEFIESKIALAAAEGDAELGGDGAIDCGVVTHDAES